MESYKIQYNKLLEKYYKNCEYFSKNPDKFDYYSISMINLINKLSELINEYNITNEEDILNGFKL